MSWARGMFRNLAHGIAERLPIIVLICFMLTLFLALPYRSLDSDAATFGLMGNDILKYHHGSTLTMGQTHLFSITPYLYALVRVLLPTLSAPLAFAIAGALLSLSGLWLVYESFLRLQRRSGGPVILSCSLFCILVAASHTYAFDLAVNSGIELSIFSLGILMYAANRIDSAPVTARCSWSWFFTGLATAYATYSRPQIAIYGLVAAVMLLIRRHRYSGHVALLAGGFIGYLPMLLHRWFIAPHWPFKNDFPLVFCHGRQSHKSLATIFGSVIPRIFSVSPLHLVYSVLILMIVALALYFFLRAATRGRLTTLDWIWLIGTVGVLIVMDLFPALSANMEQRRYCEHLYLAIAWFFSRLWKESRAWCVAALVLVVAVAVSAVAPWRARLRDEQAADLEMRRVVHGFIPEVQSHDGIILAHYWDAYLLSFLADGKLRIEAYPWCAVRTYGLFTEDEFAKRTLWLSKVGYGKNTWRHLQDAFGTEAMKTMQETSMTNRLLGHECSLWEFPDSTGAVRLMRQYHPLYFSTQYPPGS